MSKVVREVFVHSTRLLCMYTAPRGLHLADPAPMAGKPASQAAGDNGLLGPDTMC